MKKLLILTLLLAACAKHAAVTPPTRGTAEDWAYYPMDGKPGQFYVVAKTDEALKNAMTSLGCGVCAPDYIGEFYTVLVVKKAEGK